MTNGEPHGCWNQEHHASSGCLRKGIEVFSLSFYEGSLSVTGRRRAFVTILNEPAGDDDTVRRLGALDKFFAEIERGDEKVPEFERVKLREIEILVTNNTRHFERIEGLQLIDWTVQN